MLAARAVLPLADFDFETYSEAGYFWREDKQRWVGTGSQGKGGIEVVGAPAYAEHPSTELLSLAYNLKAGQGEQLWVPGLPPPQDLFTYLAAGGLIEAWNDLFEWYIWHHVCRAKMGWPILPLTSLRCAMAKSAAFGWPGKLELAAKVAGAGEQKDNAGTLVMRKLSKPRNPTKADKSLRHTPQSAPDDYAKLYGYCIQDIRAERAVSALAPELSPYELKVWQLDHVINTRGVAVDMVGLQACQQVLDTIQAEHQATLRDLTGIADITVDQTAVIRGWCGGQGYPMASVDKDHVTWALADSGIPEEVKKVLDIRKKAGAAGVKKLKAILRTVSADGRVRDLFSYYGARHTGRFAGRGAQPQNVPASGPDVVQCTECGRIQSNHLVWCMTCGCMAGPVSVAWSVDAAESALADLTSGDMTLIKANWRDPIEAISGCLRGMFCSAPGHDLICSDFAAIEAVVLAILAGEQWRIDVFNTHGKIYEMSVALLTGMPLAEILKHKERTGQHHPLRKTLGKIAELASGYAGWIPAWKNFGADKYLNDEEIKVNILKWRDASPAIVEMWGGQWRKNPHRWEWTPELFGVEGAAVSAILAPGKIFQYRYVAYCVLDKVLYCKLPSGRNLVYHNPRLSRTVAPFGEEVYQIEFDGYNSDSSKGPVGWLEMETYGGKLVENITQAVARDILVNSMLNVEAAGYPIVLHVHDEIVSEVPQGAGTVAHFEAVMNILPSWAAGWPVKAVAGWRGHRYRKD